ncbi:hypothetical protein CEXT_122381 [Caerostris extrusa]|uniref:Uncharacterized protein n=1 Tax=Caerostris extrusa TaxID=172846 RepID=A0AAV4YB56_CAEEX|nr:hypothetical protein CEXT_122381 [Caerostris extrusa]
MEGDTRIELNQQKNLEKPNHFVNPRRSSHYLAHPRGLDAQLDEPLERHRRLFETINERQENNGKKSNTMDGGDTRIELNQHKNLEKPNHFVNPRRSSHYLAHPRGLDAQLDELERVD